MKMGLVPPKIKNIMDNKSNSIWKKNLKLPGLFMAWLILIAATMFVFLLLFLIGGGSFLKVLNRSDLTKTFIASLIVATVVFGLWLFIRWLCCGRNFKRFLFGLACLATLLALVYAEEDWRGWHAWHQFKREWEARGEKLDYANILPPAVPDEQNFALAPIWVESIKATLGPQRARLWYGDKFPDHGRTNFTERLLLETWHQRENLDAPSRGDWKRAERTDLKAWQAGYRATNRITDARLVTNDFPVAPQPQSPAQDVLLALSPHAAAIEELRQASRLAYSRFPLDYDAEDPFSILLPHLAALKRASQVLQLRAVAELENGQREQAFDDVKLALRLTDSLRTEPIMISQLVRIAMLELTLQPVWEGLAEHRWSEAQMVALDAELAKLDFLADDKIAQKSDIFFSAEEANYLRRHREYANQFAQMGFRYPMDARFKFALYRFMPGGWFYQSALKNGRTQMEYWPAVNHDTMTISPTLIRRADAAANSDVNFFDPLDSLKKMFNEDFLFMGNFLKQIAYGQASTDLARTAMALERYRLAHGDFPESLDALAPQFIAQVPRDVIGGQSLKYRRTADGQFVLYSIGWNETDDGGVVVDQKSRDRWNENGSKVDISQGDWVWRYPAR